MSKLIQFLTILFLVDQGKKRYSNFMAQLDCIYISSSDDDLELEEIENPNNGSHSGRPAHESNAGNDGGHTNGSSLRRANTSNTSSSGAYNHSPFEHYTEPGSSSYMPNRGFAHGDGSFNNSKNGYTSQFQTINSRIAKSSGADYEKMPSQQAFKRTISSSPLPAAMKPLPSFQSFAPGSSMNGSNDVMYQNGGIRMLPPPMIHGAGEERTSENDERLIYQAALEDLNQPKVEANLPDGLMSVSLLRHQKIALAWMVQKETRSLHCLGGILADDQGLGKTISMIALIQMQRQLQSKWKTDEISNHKAEALNLDEDDENDNAGDTGKNEDDTKPIPESVSSSSTSVVSRKRPAAGTLVVCPASVLRQWARELDEKVGDEAKLSVLIYHGGNRTKDPVELAKYDVVLTTYSIVTNEVPKQPLVEEDEVDERLGERFGLSSEFAFGKKRKKACNNNNASKKSKKGKKGLDSSFECASGALAKVGWFRVILDEAQTIKNHRTQVARACCSLRAKRRWCLSGTPIQNAIEDLYSYFRFLKYDPYAVYKSFYNTIKVPISKNSIQGYKKLQAVLRAVMLRRTKGTSIDGQPIITLPPKTIKLSKVDFSIEERGFYTKLESDSRNQFKAYAAAGTVNQNYANILLMLLRLRQACGHPLLVKDYGSDYVGEHSIEMARTLPKDLLINLHNRLEASSAICQVCNDTPEDPVVTMCGHVFCYQCVSEHMTGYENMCPAADCKEQIGDDVVFSKATLRSCISGDLGESSSLDSRLVDYSAVQQSNYSSSKIKSLLEILELHCGSGRSRNSLPPETSDIENLDPDVIITRDTRKCSAGTTNGPIKAIVFSQWTSMLDLVEDSLKDSGIRYRRLDGTMTLTARDKSVKDFNTDPEVVVMLMSLKAGNLGLNLVAACHVILLDLWWNPTTEDQAVDRAHRIGQTRPVTVTRLTIRDTVEDRILALQEDKRKMVASAFGEDQAGGTATRLTVDDLKYLFMV